MDRNSKTPPAYTCLLPTRRQFHARNALDVAQNLGRVAEAVVLSPVHLVQQITGHHGQPVRWIRPSRHQQRMAARPDGEQKYEQAAIHRIARMIGDEGDDVEELPKRKHPKLHVSHLGEGLWTGVALLAEAAFDTRSNMPEPTPWVTLMFQPMPDGPMTGHPAPLYVAPPHLDRGTGSSEEPTG